MDKKYIESQADKIANEFKKWEEKYLKKLGKAIKNIKERPASTEKTDLNFQELAAITALSIIQSQIIYETALEEEKLSNKKLYNFRKIPFSKTDESIIGISRNQAAETAKNIINLTKTSALCTIEKNGKIVSLQSAYVNALNETVEAVKNGKNVSSEIRNTIKALGGNGINVRYTSGYVRRLDTSVRQAVLWGAKQASLEHTKQMSEELKCDGIEIDWHFHPRPSHEFMQGKQYSTVGTQIIDGVKYLDASEAKDPETGKNVYDALNDYNCLHFETPIICGVSVPRHSKQELNRLNEENARIYNIGGKDYTGYEATQAMRRLETAIRHEKGIKILAQSSGEKGLVNECNVKIKEYRAKYSEIVEITGIKEDLKRMSI